MSDVDPTAASPGQLDSGAPVPAPSVAVVPEPDFGAAAPRPELPIAGAFAGGLITALLLKRLAR